MPGSRCQEYSREHNRQSFCSWGAYIHSSVEELKNKEIVLSRDMIRIEVNKIMLDSDRHNTEK